MTKSQSLVVVAGCVVAALICLALVVIAHQSMQKLSGERDRAQSLGGITAIQNADAATTLLVA